MEVSLLGSELKSRLIEVCEKTGVEAVTVSVWRKREESCLSVGSKEHPAFRVGCIAKPMTAMLVAKAIHEGKIGLDDSICDLVPLHESAAATDREGVRGIRIRHLLNHSDGLDDSALVAPVTNDGNLIDAPELCRKLMLSAPLVPPGTAYNYGNGGYWLIAAMLEKLYGAPFRELFFAEMDDCIGGVSDVNRQSSLCPSTGSELSLLAEQLMRLLRINVAPGPLSSILAAFRREPAKYPGWGPTNVGAHCGWNDYGGNWFGHSAFTGQHSVMVRFNEAGPTAIVIAAPSSQAPKVFAGLFQRILPEFQTRSDTPRYLTREEWDTAAGIRILGRYENAGSKISIEPSTDRAGPLQLHLRKDANSAGDSEQVQRAHLVPASGDTYFATPMLPTIRFVQPFTLGGDGVTHLWNGAAIWRRTP